MKHMKFLTFFFCIAFAVFACSSNNETDPNAGGLPDKEEPLATDFAKGADISWVTEMEHKGMKFYNTSGVETDCFQLMKDLGLNAVRLRVWVDPKEHDNWQYGRFGDESQACRRAGHGRNGRLPLQ